MSVKLEKIIKYDKKGRITKPKEKKSLLYNEANVNIYVLDNCIVKEKDDKVYVIPTSLEKEIEYDDVYLLENYIYFDKENSNDVLIVAAEDTSKNMVFIPTNGIRDCPNVLDRWILTYLDEAYGGKILSRDRRTSQDIVNKMCKPDASPTSSKRISILFENVGTSWDGFFHWLTRYELNRVRKFLQEKLKEDKKKKKKSKENKNKEEK